MSVATVKPKSFVLPAQALDAVCQAAAELDLEDPKLVAVALVRTALDGCRKNPGFASHVRNLYRDLAARQPTRGANRAVALPPLVPIKQVDARDPDPSAPPDPYRLLEMYGRDQLARALVDYTMPPLREAMRQVKAANPGTRPVGTSKQALIDYIVRHVAG